MTRKIPSSGLPQVCSNVLMEGPKYTFVPPSSVTGKLESFVKGLFKQKEPQDVTVLCKFDILCFLILFQSDTMKWKNWSQKRINC